MRDSRVDHLEAAIGAARAGADAIRTQWRSGGVVEARTKTAVADVSTRLDEAADSAIAEFLNTVLPSPVILSEELSDESLVEKGRSLSSERWLVDPLDGSHNASIGLALVGVAIAWTESDVVRGAVLLDVFGGALLAADSSGRLVVEGDLQVGSPHRGAAVALQQAYLTPRDSAGLAAARDLLEATFPRVLYTWCPVVDMLLTARGHLVGWVAVGLDGPEYSAIRFLAEKIGLLYERYDPPSESHHSPHVVVVCWPGYQQGLQAAARLAREL